MSLLIRKHPEVERDLTRIFVYVGEQNLDAADRFLIAVDADLRKLAEAPGMGAMREFDHPKLANLRSWPVGGFRNYLIFYRAAGPSLDVLAVIHGARDIEAVLRARPGMR